MSEHDDTISLDEAKRRRRADGDGSDQHTEPVSVGEVVDAAETVEEPLDDAIKRLADLPPLKYERCRSEEAKRPSRLEVECAK